VADANRAQFRLYRALGHPAECVLERAAVVPAAQLAAPVPSTASGFATDRPR